MKTITFYTLMCCLLLCSNQLFAAIIKGRIVNENNAPLSFANVYIKSLNIGTTCNDDGFYELKIDEGKYDIYFQYIGYKTKSESVSVKKDETILLNIKLESEKYTLKEVDVNATAEDPAYPIIRQAMAMRKVYLFEPKEYSCNVYIKGMQRLTTVPKRVLLIKVPPEIKPGIIYLTESYSELNYQQPEKFREKMISSKVSGSNKAFSFNRASAIKFNLYENIVNSYKLNERGFVSPLASDAFLSYKYKLDGEFKENGLTVFKIKIIPKREHDPVFRGYIYIVKDSWRIHSTDLMISKLSGVEFIDTLYIKQNYAEQEGGVWMPVSQRFIFQLEAYGFRGNGYFVALYSKYKTRSMYPNEFYSKQQNKIIADQRVPETKKVERVKVVKRKAKTDTTFFDKKFFNNELLAIDKKANKTDDATWDSVRPVPLTNEELLDYKQKDSVRILEESKPYMDSLDRVNNKFDWTNLFISGYTFDHSFYKKKYSIKPIYSIIQYNTVEGLVFNQELRVSKTFDDYSKYELVPECRYGFASNRAYGRINFSYEPEQFYYTRWNVSGGSFVQQFNGDVPITPLLNSAYTLLAKQNYLKEFQKEYIKASFGRNVLNGVRMSVSAEYARRSSLANQTNFTFNDINGRSFTSNIPVNNEVKQFDFAPNQAFVSKLDFEIHFAQKYITRPYRRYNFPSKYPVLNIGYVKGLNFAGSDVDFDLVNFGVSQDLDFNLFGESYYNIRTGYFMNNAKMYFMDYQHFNGNQTIFSLKEYSGFQLLDYYKYSSKQKYIEAHYEHHFNGFILNKFPLIRNLKLQEVFTFNYLKTPTSPNYIEIGAGIEHVFKILRIDFFTSFENGNQMRNGIVIGLGF